MNKSVTFRLSKSVILRLNKSMKLRLSKLMNSGVDLGFFKRESKILGSDRCDIIAMTSPIR